MQLYPGHQDKLLIYRLAAYQSLVSHLSGLGLAKRSTYSIMDREETGLGTGISLISVTARGVDVSIRDSIDSLPFNGILRIDEEGWDSARLYYALQNLVTGLKVDDAEVESLRVLLNPPKPKLRDGKITKELIEAVLGEDFTLRRLALRSKK